MTRRLAIVIASVVVATLVLAGFGTLVVGNVRSKHTTQVELRSQTTAVAQSLDQLLDTTVADRPAALRRRDAVINAFRKVLKLDGLAVLTLAADDTLSGGTLPSGLPQSVLSIPALRAGEAIAGSRGTLVYAAAPAKTDSGQFLIVVAVQQANSGVKAQFRTLLLAGLATLAIGLGLAIWLGRRLTRPIRQASAAAMGIARGELSTRLPEPSAHDHDELAELARSVNAMASELERSRVLEQQFLLSVSHDLRTPLTSIRGYAEAISDGAADPQRSATVIHSEARRLERLVADLLDLAKLRSKSFSFRVEVVDVAGLATVAAQGFEPDAAERQVAIRTVNAGPLMVQADHDRLAQVVANLLENALKYARFEVVLSTGREGEWAILAVDDDGPGIPAADLPHVFDRLYVARSQPARHESS
ncbi:MAG TPA: HAMP domain-containing sensor histidine kinase, partial [Ilumatobacteraceae bacterium]